MAPVTSSNSKGAVSLRWILRFLSGARLWYRPYLFLSQQLSSVVQGCGTNHTNQTSRRPIGIQDTDKEYFYWSTTCFVCLQKSEYFLEGGGGLDRATNNFVVLLFYSMFSSSNDIFT